MAVWGTTGNDPWTNGNYPCANRNDPWTNGTILLKFRTPDHLQMLPKTFVIVCRRTRIVLCGWPFVIPVFQPLSNGQQHWGPSSTPMRQRASLESGAVEPAGCGNGLLWLRGTCSQYGTCVYSLLFVLLNQHIITAFGSSHTQSIGASLNFSGASVCSRAFALALLTYSELLDRQRASQLAAVACVALVCVWQRK